MNANGLRVGLVGPLPPPSGGMANQLRQLGRLLREDGVDVEIVRVNAPYWPIWIGRVRGVRAVFRLAPYLRRLWSTAGRVDLFHVMANSGWAWHLFAAPAVWVAKLRGIPAVVNYRGGGAQEFLDGSILWVKPTLRLADQLIVPSLFLQDVFQRFGLSADIVPNVIDLDRFAPRAAGASPAGKGCHLVVTRNLEAVYDIGTAIRALALVREAHCEARMTVAGSGPEHDKLAGLAQTLGVAAHVTFAGRLDNDQTAALYQQADVSLNPSLVDNMPISILEALASGVPVVSTNVGGVGLIVEEGRTGRLVPARDAEAMARAVLEVIQDRQKAAELARAGRESVQHVAWARVGPRLLEIYGRLASASGSPAQTGVQ